MNSKRHAAIILYILIALVMILDSKAVLGGALDGVELCAKTVIPSLFPFFVISTMLTDSLSGTSLPFVTPVCRACGIPAGAESIFLTGILGGYPVGAQCVSQFWREGQLSTHNARRMLGFVNNAGPSFIFGMTASLFQSPMAGWLLWGIQIVSAMLVAVLLPGKKHEKVHIKAGKATTLPKALEQALRNIASVCGWVILFRVAITLCDKWFLRNYPATLRIIISGILELSNGCCALASVGDETMSFLLCSVFLSFGGLCVAMQTISAVGELGTGLYFPGKMLQSVMAFLLSLLCISMQQPQNFVPGIWIGSGMIALIIPFCFKFRKNTSRNQATSVV